MPILAYSETGTFRTDNMPVNIRKWMGKYNNFIRKIEDDGVMASAETQAEWKALRNGARKSTAAAVVGPLIKTTWDQDAPYNNLCPGTGSNKAYTGCVATAMAQVMNYWQWPVKGTGSHSYQPLDPNSDTGATSKRYGTQSANFGNTTYDWANMKNSYSGSYTDAEATAVATLMFHCGVATEMMYGNDADGGSGTYTVNYGDEEDHACAQNALWMNFGYKKSTLTGYMRDGLTYQGTQYYKKWSDSEWTAMIKAELDLNHP
ncbi:MAG: C10 family peptidase, partial [Paludibacteraceae bacterium]|nr:C10 family peptidase [Paludibacteraceae bacterium]